MNSLFNKWCWENWVLTCKRMKLGPFLMPYIKINSKWTKALSLKIKTMKLIKENVEEKCNKTGFGNDLLGTISKAQATK